MMKHLQMKDPRWQSRLLVRLICLPAALLFLALPALAQTDQILPPIGGSGGGQFNARCPQGQFLTGFELRTGDDVDAIIPICVTAYGPADVGPLEPYPSMFGGDGGGDTRQLVCPRDAPIVAGMYVGHEGARTIIVNNIHLWCGTAAATQKLSVLPNAVFDGPKYTGPTPAFPTPPGGDEQYCPAGLVAVGINGRSGKWLDAVGLICGAPTLTPRPGPGVKTFGRVKTTDASPRSICDMARDARARNSPAAPNLEAQCRAAGGVKTFGRVNLPPPSPLDPPVSICDMARRARARNSPAAPNLEAQCRAAGETPPPSAPTITADANPVMVPNGQPSGTTTITWKAAPGYTYSEIYLSVDNGAWSEFAKGGDGAKETTIKIGSSYTFRMMVYEGQAGTPKIIAILTVTALKN